MDVQAALASSGVTTRTPPGNGGGRCEHCGCETDGRFCSERCADAALARAQRIEKARTLADDLARDGLYPRRAQRVSFRESSAAIEQANPEAWARLRAWRPESSLYLCGPVGTGKTFAARCILTRAVSSLWTVAEITALDLFRLQRDFRRAEAYARLQRVRLLLLDDLDKTADWTGARTEALWEIANERAEARRRTIITANTSPARLREHIAQQSGHAGLVAAAFDRLLPLDVIEFAGASHRGRSGAR